MHRNPFSPRKTGKRCLILTGNVCVGYQVANLLGRMQWQTHVLHSDHHAYDALRRHGADVVVADIDTAGLGGLAVMGFCSQQHPDITTFAIAANEHDLSSRLAQNLGGCRGYFYLGNHGLNIDTSRGLAADPAALLVPSP